MNDKETRGVSIVFFAALIGLIFVIVMQALRIQSLRAENELKKTELAQVKVVVANPKVTKDAGIRIEYRERKIHLSEMEKEAIAQQYEMKLADLQAVIDAICAKGDRTVTITKTGKQVSEPIYPDERPKRIAVVAEVFNDYSTLGVVYEFIPKWGLSFGIAASNYGKIGGACAIRF